MHDHKSPDGPPPGLFSCTELSVPGMQATTRLSRLSSTPLYGKPDIAPTSSLSITARACPNMATGQIEAASSVPKKKRSPLCSFTHRQKFFSPPGIHHFLFPPCCICKEGPSSLPRLFRPCIPDKADTNHLHKRKTPRKAGKNGRNLPDSYSSRSFLFFPKVQSQVRTPCAATIPYGGGKKSGCLDGHGEPWL